MTKQWRPLTDPQWAAISPFFDLKRKRKHDLRQMIDIILWLLRTGCQWRNLPQEWPNWQTVYYYFMHWKQDGTFERIDAALNQLDRKCAGREPYPSVLCIDAQSVKLNPMIGEYRGIDANKRVNGRKREFVVDTEGRLWVAHVHAANEAEGPAAIMLIRDILWRAGERLEKIYGDQAYNGVFAEALAKWSINFEKASRPESAQGFVPVAKRWVVERSIAWSNRTGDPVLPAHRQRLRVYRIFCGQLALFSQYSDYTTTDLDRSPNIIPKHVLKFISSKHGNRAQELAYDALEMDAYKKDDRIKKTWDEEMILSINEITNNHGQSWLRAFLVLLLFTASMFLVIKSTLGYTIVWGSFSYSDINDYLEFAVNPLHDFSKIFKSGITIPTNKIEEAKTYDFLSRLCEGIILFQLVRAFRKYARSDAG